MSDTPTHPSSPARHLPPALASVVGFLPWIVYWILVGNVPFATSVSIAFAVAVVVNLATVWRTHRVRMFEAGALAVFAVLLVLTLVGEDAFLERWIQPLSNAGILAVALVSVLSGRPFTEEYARDAVPPEVRATAGFHFVNVVLAWVWVAAFAVMTVSSFIPPIVQGEATIKDGGSTLSIVCYWVIPFTALGLAGVVTGKFPDWFVGSIERQMAPAQRVPAAPPAAPADHAAVDGRTLRIEPAEGPLDAPLAVTVDGVPAGSAVVLEAAAADAYGTLWRSRETVAADAGGRATADGRIVWSMTPDPEAGPVGIFLPPNPPWALTVTATEGGTELARTVVRGTTSGIRCERVGHDDVVGEIHLPAGPGPHPGVLVLPGSEGGLDSQRPLARLLAVHGMAALVLAFVGAEGLGEEIVRVPLERIGAGSRLLAARPEVDGDRLAGMSLSRGSEALLLAAAHVPGLGLRALVLVSPSCAGWQAMDGDGTVAGASAWTLGGDDIPFLPVRDDRLMPQFLHHALPGPLGGRRAGAPVLLSLYEAYATALKDDAAVAAAAIPAACVSAPLLLIAGDDDRLWPSVDMARRVAGSRAGGETAAGDELLVLPGTGHLIRPPLLPTGEAWLDGIAFGGTPEGSAAGHARAWSHTLAFLERHLTA